jgi:hypothetical protein
VADINPGEPLPVRMPNGVMDYLERGSTPVEQAEAECAAATGDPESYERALARHNDPCRVSSVRYTGRPILTMIIEALESIEED